MSSRLPRALLHCKISHFALPVVLWMGTSDDGVRPSHSGSPAALHQDVIGFSTAALTVPLCLLIGRSGQDTRKQGLQAQWGACQATLFWLGCRSPIGDVCNEAACWPTICYATCRSQCLNTILWTIYSVCANCTSKTVEQELTAARAIHCSCGNQ